MQNYYFCMFLAFLILSIYCLTFAQGFEQFTCLKNDTSPTATMKSTQKFLKEIGALKAYDATLPCPAGSYDDRAFEVAEEAAAKAALAATLNVSKATSTTTSGGSGGNRRLLENSVPFVGGELFLNS